VRARTFAQERARGPVERAVAVTAAADQRRGRGDRQSESAPRLGAARRAGEGRMDRDSRGAHVRRAGRGELRRDRAAGGDQQVGRGVDPERVRPEIRHHADDRHVELAAPPRGREHRRHRRLRTDDDVRAAAPHAAEQPPRAAGGQVRLAHAAQRGLRGLRAVESAPDTGRRAQERVVGARDRQRRGRMVVLRHLHARNDQPARAQGLLQSEGRRGVPARLIAEDEQYARRPVHVETAFRGRWRP